MNTTAIAAIITAVILLIIFIRIYAKHQVTINNLQAENKEQKAELARMKDLIQKFQEVDDEAKDSSHSLDNDIDAELEFMQNPKPDD